jgi:hypothetical protein
MDASPKHKATAWQPNQEPVPVQVAVVHSDPDRIRDLEEGQRQHATQLADHENVLKDIRLHLEELVSQFSKLRVTGLIAVLIIFGGTQNGEKLVKLLGGLFG